MTNEEVIPAILRNMEYPTILGMSLANVCCGKCVWCPIGRGIYTQRRDKFMTMDTVENIIRQFSPRPPKEIWFSENGESLLNPNFKEIVVKFRRAFPHASLRTASNMALMDEETSLFLLKTGFNWISFNIDGADKESYRVTKGLDLDVVLKNVKALINNYNAVGSNAALVCNIFPAARYYAEIGEPHPELVDDTHATFQMMREIMARSGDCRIFCPFPLTWAKREEWKRPKWTRFCSGLPQVWQKAFIDTDGNLYPCCVDYNSDYIYGNINEDMLGNIWYGDRHVEFIKNILLGDVDKIGKPCVWCQD